MEHIFSEVQLCINISLFNEFCENRDINQTQQSIFAPWFLLKDEYFDKIGGHDTIYAPYGYEDSDIENNSNSNSGSEDDTNDAKGDTPEVRIIFLEKGISAGGLFARR